MASGMSQLLFVPIAHDLTVEHHVNSDGNAAGTSRQVCINDLIIHQKLCLLRYFDHR